MLRGFSNPINGLEAKSEPRAHPLALDSIHSDPPHLTPHPSTTFSTLIQHCSNACPGGFLNPRNRLGAKLERRAHFLALHGIHSPSNPTLIYHLLHVDSGLFQCIPRGFSNPINRLEVKSERRTHFLTLYNIHFDHLPLQPLIHLPHSLYSFRTILMHALGVFEP
ncbi:hypothetical protein BDN72DRAFT_851453, partial [Pluteus cervinus]